MNNLPPPTLGRWVQSPNTGAVFQEYDLEDICILVREPEEDTEKSARREFLSQIMPGMAVLVNLAAAMVSMYILVTKDGIDPLSAAGAFAASLFLLSGAFALGVWAHRHWVQRGPVEHHINAKYWHHLYGRFLKDLMLNINGDLVAVWKRNELVIRKLKLWGDT